LSEPVEITRADLALLVQALEDAAFFREARSRVLQTAHRRAKREPLGPSAGSDDREAHRRKADAYLALAAKLKATRAK
jgi:hypothetical protein